MATPKWIGGNVTNDATHRFVTDTQISTWNSKAAGNHTHNYAGSASAGGAAKSVANSLILNLNGGTTEGTSKFTYDGSAAKTVNITPAAIGAANKSHTHDYLPLTGGTIDGVNNLKVVHSSIAWVRAQRKDSNYIEMNSGVSSPILGAYNKDGTAIDLSIDAKTVTTTNLTVTGTLSGTASSAKKVEKALTITAGTSSVVYNGSAALAMTITPALIGAATSSHTHNYAGSTSAGGAAKSVANSLTIQFNGTAKATYNGSAAKTVNITPAAIAAVGTENDQTINGALTVNNNPYTGSSTGMISIYGTNASILNLAAQDGSNWRLGTTHTEVTEADSSLFAISTYRSDVSAYVPKITMRAKSAFTLRGSIVARTTLDEDIYGSDKLDDTLDNTRSICMWTSYRKFGLYTVASPTSKGVYTGLYEWSTETDSSGKPANETGAGWVLWHDKTNNLVHMPKPTIINKILTTTSGLNWRSDAGTDYLLIGYGSSSNFTNFTRVGNTSYQMSLYTSGKVWLNGSKTSYFSTATTGSDERLKERISDMSKYEEFFTKINPFAFKYHDGLYNAPNTKPLITWGYSAQETIKAFTECGIDWEEQDLVVVEDADALSSEETKYADDGKLLKMAYQNMIPLNTHMIQKVMEENTQLKSRIADLEAKIDLIMSKLDITE